MKLLSRTLPIAALGAAAVVAFAGGIANATVTSGTGTFTISGSYLSTVAQSCVFAQTSGAQSVSYDSTSNTVTAVYTATGGDADVRSSAGSELFSGGFTVTDRETDKSVTFGSLKLDLLNGVIDVTPAGGSQVAGLDVAGTVSGTVSGSTQTFSATKLKLDTALANYLDSTLGTTVFHAGDVVGSFSSTFTVA